MEIRPLSGSVLDGHQQAEPLIVIHVAGQESLLIGSVTATAPSDERDALEHGRDYD
jgi:hypothetical protein